MPESTTQILSVPGAQLAMDVRVGTASDGAPPLLVVGSPMGASGFLALVAELASRTGRTIATYDPRGVERSVRTDPAPQSTPQQHADDLAAVIGAIGPEVDLFASSGGAVNALALLARHPGLVRTLVAHEPPLASLVEDREEALAACVAIRETYLRDGFAPAMARFIAVVSHPGPLPAGFAQAPGPDPALFGLPTEDEDSSFDPLLGQNIVTSTHYEPDLDALRSSSTRIVVAVGAESGETLAARAARSLADLLGVTPAVFPGDHGGFLGSDLGQSGDPAAFADALVAVLR